jgi:hypothetical protein
VVRRTVCAQLRHLYQPQNRAWISSADGEYRAKEVVHVFSRQTGSVCAVSREQFRGRRVEITKFESVTAVGKELVQGTDVLHVR